MSDRSLVNSGNSHSLDDVLRFENLFLTNSKKFTDLLISQASEEAQDLTCEIQLRDISVLVMIKNHI